MLYQIDIKNSILDQQQQKRAEDDEVNKTRVNKTRVNVCLNERTLTDARTNQLCTHSNLNVCNINIKLNIYILGLWWCFPLNLWFNWRNPLSCYFLFGNILFWLNHSIISYLMINYEIKPNAQPKCVTCTSIPIIRYCMQKFLQYFLFWRREDRKRTNINLRNIWKLKLAIFGSCRNLANK